MTTPEHENATLEGLAATLWALALEAELTGAQLANAALDASTPELAHYWAHRIVGHVEALNGCSLGGLLRRLALLEAVFYDETPGDVDNATLERRVKRWRERNGHVFGAALASMALRGFEEGSTGWFEEHPRTSLRVETAAGGDGRVMSELRKIAHERGMQAETDD
jgi:hypothetical protein